MTMDQAIILGRKMLETAFIVGTPVLLITFIVGVLISILQAATQIHEMTLTFIPKIVAALVAVFIFGAWMMIKLVNYTKENFKIILVLIK